MMPNLFEAPLHLPFNRSSLAEKFTPASPDADPGEEGVTVLLRGTELLLKGEGTILPAGTLEDALELSSEPLFIGRWKGAPCRAAAVSRNSSLPQGWRAANILSAEPALPVDLLSLAGVAGQMLHWEKNSRCCSRCGGAPERLSGEWGKRCLCCGYDHFPHIHPCIIVLVRREGEVLLTRKPGWPSGRYSLVAGFLDFGEALEEAVVREVREETGIEVKNIRYVGSQSWPFPSQLMAGFIAEYAGGEVQVEEKELEDARWFSTEALPSLPPQRSIARHILDHYLHL